MNAQVMLGRLTQAVEILPMIPVARVVMEVLNIVTPIADGTRYLSRAFSVLHDNQIIPSINPCYEISNEDSSLDDNILRRLANKLDTPPSSEKDDLMQCISLGD